MAAIPTGLRELDRKLYRIIHEADTHGILSATDLAERIRTGQFEEFSYRREGRLEMATVATIERYVVYAQAISLLDSRLQPTVKPSEIREQEPFQRWLGDHALHYLNNSGCTIEEIKRVARTLLAETPPRPPTINNVHGKLPASLDRWAFEYSVRLLARLRPTNFRLRSRPTFFIRGVLNE